jgi:two-component system, LytTR family, sensor kinase
MDAEIRINWRFIIKCAVALTLAFSFANWTTQQVTFPIVLLRQAIVWGLWLVFAPAIFAIQRRFPYEESPGARWITLQIGFATLFGVAHAIIGASLRHLLGINLVPSFAESVAIALLANFGGNYLRYGLIAVSYQVVAYHRTVRKRDAQAAKLKIDLAEAKLATLEGRLRPHFLFNTLNAIAALIREDPAAAEAMVGQLSDLLRASLKADPLREVTLQDELTLVEQYLSIEHARFQERLGVSLEATEAARNAYVPHLILQPLVENAVRHGISPREAGGSIWVQADQIGERLVVTVEDDGVGIGNAPQELAGNGVGLGGVRSRLAHLYGSDHTLDVEARRPSGTRVRIEIPYRAAATPLVELRT